MTTPFCFAIKLFQRSFVSKDFVAFCSFFPCSLTVVHRGRQRKSGGRQWKSSVKLFSREYTLKCFQLSSSSDNKKVLLTTKNVRLADTGRYAILLLHLGIRNNLKLSKNIIVGRNKTEMAFSPLGTAITQKY